MTEVNSFPALLRHWTARLPEHAALVFLADGETETTRITFGELGRLVADCAASLRAAGAPGRPVLLIHPPGIDFIVAFCACLETGAIAVPVPDQSRSRSWERIRAISSNSGAVAVLGDHSGLASEALGLPLLEAKGTSSAHSATTEMRADHPAFLQYTSGSTGDPKGVVVTHEALVANILMLKEGLAIHENTRMVTWLPMFHDMGLVTLATALYSGVTSILLPPLTFLQRPARWLSAISSYGATLSGGPNFAFQACLSRVSEQAAAGLDLSSWECAFCGAEPIRPETLESFAQRFSQNGFRAGALYPAYGLAEATLFVTGSRVGRGLRTFNAPQAGKSRPLVSCGSTIGAGTVVIVDPSTSVPAPAGSVGEIWVSGPHVASGYWQNPGLSAEVFGARLAGRPDPFLRTGDLGLLHEGELYVAGRLKDLLIVNGENLSPEDIEATVRSSHPGFGQLSAAFSVDFSDAEQIIVAQEVDRKHLRSLDVETAVDVAMRAAASAHGVRLLDLVLLRPGAIPCTSSGKVQRKRARELYLSGALSRLGR